MGFGSSFEETLKGDRESSHPVSIDNKSVADLLHMCTDSERQIAKLEWLCQHGAPADSQEREAMEELIQTIKDLHTSLKQAYEAASGKRFQSKMIAYRKRLRQKLSN